MLSKVQILNHESEVTKETNNDPKNSANETIIKMDSSSTTVDSFIEDTVLPLAKVQNVLESENSEVSIPSLSIESGALHSDLTTQVENSTNQYNGNQLQNETEQYHQHQHQNLVHQTHQPQQQNQTHQSNQQQNQQQTQIHQYHQPQQTQQNNQSTNTVQKDTSEAIVGKYIVGGFASLLIFIAAISLLGLVWKKITPEMVLAFITLMGVMLTGVGFILTKKKKNNIHSIILGTGAGLLYIAILIGDLAFNLISHNIAIILSGILSVLFILSSRYLKLFFTIIIAFLGSFIALLEGLVLVKNDLDLFMLVIYTSIISGVMLYNAYTQKYKNQTIVSILLSICSFSTILISTLYDGYSSPPVLTHFITQTLVIVIIYSLLYALIKMTDDRKYDWNICIAIFVAIITVFYFAVINKNYLHLNALPILVIFFIITTSHLVITNLTLKNTRTTFSILYTIILLCNSLLISIEWFEGFTGVVMVALILMVIDELCKRNEHQRVAISIVLVDVILLQFSNEFSLFHIVCGILQGLLMIHILYKNYKVNYKYIDFLKISGIITILLNSYAIPKQLYLFITNVNYYQHYNTIHLIGAIVAFVSFFVLAKKGIFFDWTHDSMNDSQIRYKFINKHMKISFIVFSTCLLFLNLIAFYSYDRWYEYLINSMILLAIAFIQTYHIVIYKRKNAVFSEAWIGLKYLIIIWSIIASFTDLGAISVIYSVIGLIIAIASIAYGFKYLYKGLRLYGLILTIIMVAKFILIDLNDNNSIIRVMSFVFGGFICFGISILYNKLNERLKY